MKIIFSLSVLLLLATTARGNYCNWDGCDGRPQGCCDNNALNYCNGNEDQCESGCGSGAQWCLNSFSYCTWSTCDGVIRSTEFCNASAENCANNCNGMWCTNGGGSGGDPGRPTPAPMEGSTTPAPFSFSTGTATTTRYWDCSGGACGCGYGDSGKPAHCYSNAMFSAPANNVHGATFYGTAAVSQVLFGEGSWLGSGCGTCYKLKGTSNVGQGGVDTTIVLKAANLCPGNSNPSCSGGKIHFDIAAPGFDFTASSASNTCNDGREPIEKDAFGECEFWPSQSCDCGVFQDEVLEAGCNNFKSLNWNNPTVTYEAVACPVELERLSCWEENGGSWPFNPPEFCATNVHTSSSTPSPVAPGPTPSPVTPGPTPSPVTPGPTPSPVTPGPTPPAGTTQSPVTPGPTPAPATPGPTLSPVTPGPTPTPVTPGPTPSPTKAPSSPGGGGKSCCSQNLRDCDVSGWCASKRNRCEGNCNHFWIPDDKSCEIPLYGECTNNLNGCCSPAICQGDNANYKQCLL